MSQAGWVLVGGKSSRMGQDKAWLDIAGIPMAAAVATTVFRAAGSVTLVGSPALYEGLGFPTIPDLHPGEGPLGGVITALRVTPSRWNLILACDMPSVPVEFLKTLLYAADKTECDCLVPLPPGGRLEPLCAAWNREALPALETLFRRGVRKMGEALAEIRAVEFPEGEPQWFRNINTLAEWKAYCSHRAPRMGI